MITSMKLTGKYAERVGAKKQRTFSFKEGINLLVGPNASGKSTVVEAITKMSSVNDGGRAPDDVKIRASGKIKVHSFDFEKDSLRTKGHFVDGGLFHVQLASKFKSHGEVNRSMARGMLNDKRIEDGLVVLDEPDQALDYDGIVELVSWLKSCSAKQMIVSVHHPLLVLQSGVNVIELRKGYCEEMKKSLRDLLGVS